MIATVGVGRIYPHFYFTWRVSGTDIPYKAHNLVIPGSTPGLRNHHQTHGRASLAIDELEEIVPPNGVKKPHNMSSEQMHDRRLR